jgi:hypothetical protein
MADPFFNTDEIREFTQIPKSLTSREQIDSITYNIMEGIAQLVTLQGGNSELSEIPTAPKFSIAEQNNNANVLLCGVLEELQKLNHKIEVLLS